MSSAEISLEVAFFKGQPFLAKLAETFLDSYISRAIVRRMSINPFIFAKPSRENFDM